MTRTEAITAANRLLDERDAIWSKVTGATAHGRGASAELEVHGVTSADIGRVAAINGEVSSLRRRFDLYGAVRA